MVHTLNLNNEDRLNPESFCFWLQGFIEMSGATSINEAQMKVLKEHLELVFKRVATYSVPQQTPITGHSDNIAQHLERLQGLQGRSGTLTVQGGGSDGATLIHGTTMIC